MSDSGIKQVWIGADEHKRLKALAAKENASMRTMLRLLLDAWEKKGKR